MNKYYTAEQKRRKERQEKAKKRGSERLAIKKTKFKEIDIYHFTDEKNIPSIKEHGLFGWESLENEPFNYKREINYYPASDIPKKGKPYGLSRWLDYREGYTDYIRLTSNKNHPMIDKAIYRNSLNLKFLKISNEIIEDIGCLFSSMNATDNDTEINGNISTYLESDNPQKEILVHHHIPASYIEEIQDY